MRYDIFISYSSPDRAWAKKLEADLRERDVNCFFDQTRLKKGAKWEPQLVTGLQDSRHFVVLWSENARNSTWVNEELVRFKASIDPKGAGQPLPGRLLYSINLEGENATLAAYQGYVDKEIQAAYKQLVGTTEIRLKDPALQAWDALVAEIAAAAKSNDPAIYVPVAVLALTASIFNGNPPRTPEFDFLQECGVDDFLLRLVLLC
jgi:hypothetical protein